MTRLSLSKIKSEVVVKSASGQRGGRVGADARRGGRGEVGGLGGGRARTVRVAGGGGAFNGIDDFCRAAVCEPQTRLQKVSSDGDGVTVRKKKIELGF